MTRRRVPKRHRPYSGGVLYHPGHEQHAQDRAQREWAETCVRADVHPGMVPLKKGATSAGLHNVEDGWHPPGYVLEIRFGDGTKMQLDCEKPELEFEP